MVNEYFHQVSSTFEAAQCILFPILFTPIISQNCRHCKAPRLLCSINAISSPSCIFKLQNPIVLHCLISPLKKLGRLELFYGVNSPKEIHSCNSFYQLQKNLKVTRNPLENATQGRYEYFHQYICSPPNCINPKAGERGGRGGQNTWGPDWFGGPRS